MINFLLWVGLIGLVVTAIILRVRASLRRRIRLKDNETGRQKTVNRILAGGERHHVQGIYERVEPMRKFVERSFDRLDAAIADGDAEALLICENIDRGGEADRLLDFLVVQQEDKPDVVARSREIATIGYLTGDLATASTAVEKILSLFKNDLDALTRCGMICYLRGDIEQAKDIYYRVLKIAKHNRNEEEQAAAHINLGLLFQIIGKVGEAEFHHAEALKIYEKQKNEEGMADCMVNLALCHQVRSEMTRAEKVFRQALEINERLQRAEALAVNCGCLGLLIYHNRGDLDDAERLLGTSLDLNSRLGRLGGMASAYGNMGLVRFKRGDSKGARELFDKSLTLYQKINRPKLALKVQGWLEKIKAEDASDIAPAQTQKTGA